MGLERKLQCLSCQKTVQCETQLHLRAWLQPCTPRDRVVLIGDLVSTGYPGGPGRAAEELGTRQSWGRIPVPTEGRAVQLPIPGLFLSLLGDHFLCKESSSGTHRLLPSSCTLQP